VVKRLTPMSTGQAHARRTARSPHAANSCRPTGGEMLLGQIELAVVDGRIFFSAVTVAQIFHAHPAAAKAGCGR